MASLRFIYAGLTFLLFGAPGVAAEGLPSTFNDALENFQSLPQFQHATIGVEVYSLDRAATLIDVNSQQLFGGASTTKVVTMGTALMVLGPSHRFHTRVYRTGPVIEGVLHGNLLLVASGDPNLSGRAGPDGRLRYSHNDHSYGGFNAEAIGNPLAAIEDLGEQIVAAGIRRIEGQVLVDVGLFGEGAREDGTNVVISPISVNDNIIDIMLSPGSQEQAPVRARISPENQYVRLVNRVKTVAPEMEAALTRSQKALPDGTIELTLKGQLPSGHGGYLYPYPVPSPSEFAASLLSSDLRRRNVEIVGALLQKRISAEERVEKNQVAEVVSAPLSETVKVTLKVSQNLHAAMMPYILGSFAGSGSNADEAGFGIERQVLLEAGLDPAGAAQSHGHGSSSFTPDFMVRYLAFQASGANAALFRDALPILGDDGSLDNTPYEKAAGQVFAKTGTLLSADYLNNRPLVNAAGLVGYATTVTGERVAFAIYVNNVAVDATLNDIPTAAREVQKVVSTPIKQLAAAIHLLPIE